MKHILALLLLTIGLGAHSMLDKSIRTPTTYIFTDDGTIIKKMWVGYDPQNNTITAYHYDHPFRLATFGTKALSTNTTTFKSCQYIYTDQDSAEIKTLSFSFMNTRTLLYRCIQQFEKDFLQNPSK